LAHVDLGVLEPWEIGKRRRQLTEQVLDMVIHRLGPFHACGNLLEQCFDSFDQVRATGLMQTRR
jgi:hypothetical protein